MKEYQEPVYRYLTLCGYAQRPAWFQGTGYRIGWAFSTRLYTMTWRQKNNVLLVCDIQGTQNQQGLESASGALILLWKKILQDVDEINEIHGLPGEYGSERENQHRRKMKALLIRQGAREIDVDGDAWLAFP
ncbi:MAG TPA: hypothetical protein VGL07_13370 [Buttiauxella sp.]|jgi:hypothetical protein